MHRHYTYFMHWFPDEMGAVFEKFTAGVILGLTLIVLAWLATRRIKNYEGLKSEIIPSSSFSLFGFFDVFMEGFVAFHDSILGENNRRYISLTGSIFLFIFCANLLGLVPGMPAITTTVGVNLALALVVFVAFNFYGVREHGVIGYLKHFFGGPQMVKGWLIIIGFFICALEMLSTVLRVLTLNLRLYWNITADHLVLSTMVNLVPNIFKYFVPSFFYLLGTFVSFMQAFVFTVLTMIYILLATQHGDEEH